MAVIPYAAKWLGGRAWLLEWSSGLPPYKLFLKGRDLISRGMESAEGYTDDTSIVVSSEYNTEPPDLEVLDSLDADFNSPDFTSFVILQWRTSKDAVQYLIERFIVGVSGWTQVARTSETGEGYYRFEYPVADPDLVMRWRVRAVDRLGNIFGLFDVQIYFMSTFPRVPELTYTYNQGAGGVDLANV